MNDHQLLSAYVEGDEQAFETLVEKYFRMVYTVAARQTGDPHLAEEIAQSVFIILSRKARGISSMSSIPGWLLRTTRFVCRDAIKMRIRRDQNERKLAMDLEHQHETKPEPGAMELLLEEAIQALQPDEQAGIVARFFEGKNFEEIAEMFAISEQTARKRASRCLAKLQSFMAKRGGSISEQTLFSLLAMPLAQETANQALQSAIHAVHAAWKGQIVAKNAAILADRAVRFLRRRFLARLSVKVGLPVLLLLVAAWSLREWNRTASDKIETLGRSWGALDRRVAEHTWLMVHTNPNSPNYQAKIQEDIGAISRESSRVISEFNPLLESPGGRDLLAKFLTAELDETLMLDPSQKEKLFAYIQSRLVQSPNVNAGMKLMAETRQPEASEIKAMLSPAQRQLFDQIYGQNGSLLFTYAQVVALGKVGP